MSDNGTEIVIRKRSDGSHVEIPASVPNNAPTPHFDPFDPELRISDVLVENYFNIENVQAAIKANDGIPPVFAFERVYSDFVYNPETGVQSGDWKLVVEFQATPTQLVLNRTRSSLLIQAAGTDKLAEINDRLRGTPFALDVQVMNGHQQVVLIFATPVDAKGVENLEPVDLEEVNADLFGG